jgi:GH24 family phage-related lysozyme (muramidase)
VNVSKAGIALIKHHEGVRNKPYQCPAKLWTVGSSTIRQALLRNDKKAAMESLVKYCRAGGKILRGLQIRRLDERSLFEGK